MIFFCVQNLSRIVYKIVYDLFIKFVYCLYNQNSIKYIIYKIVCKIYSSLCKKKHISVSFFHFFLFPKSVNFMTIICVNFSRSFKSNKQAQSYTHVMHSSMPSINVSKSVIIMHMFTYVHNWNCVITLNCCNVVLLNYLHTYVSAYQVGAFNFLLIVYVYSDNMCELSYSPEIIFKNTV
jgi:hypothetical protein